MTPDPYDNDDDDAPTLQRVAPGSGHHLARPPTFPSGVRPAYHPPVDVIASAEELSSELLDEEASPFPPEDDTAVDRLPLPPLPHDPHLAETDELLAETATRLPSEPPPSEGADGEKDTVTLPVDIAEVLQRASAAPEPPRNPLSEPMRRRLPSRP